MTPTAHSIATTATRKDESAELTPWFPVSVKPARAGVYEILTEGGIGLPWKSEYRKRMWLGTMGRDCSPAEVSRFGRRHGKTDAPITHWRGLAQEPKA